MFIYANPVDMAIAKIKWNYNEHNFESSPTLFELVKFSANQTKLTKTQMSEEDFTGQVF